MANWRKEEKKFADFLKKKKAYEAAMSPEQLKEADEVFYAKYATEVSDEEEAAELLAEAPNDRLVQELAKGIAKGGLPCCNACFAPVVRGAQARQQRLRARYGASWHGHERLQTFMDGRDKDVRARAWMTVRWLEERDFVTVGNGYLVWRT